MIKIEDVRIGDKVRFYCGSRKDRVTFEMEVEGIFKDGTLYVNFEGNDGDIIEERISNVATLNDKK